MKTIWLTSLMHSEEKVKDLIAQLNPYGLEVRGHFWEDDLGKMAWMKVRAELIKPEIALWLILASNENLTIPSIRYGLSLLTITLQAGKGFSFPIVILLTQGAPSSIETLPTPLKGVDFLSLSDAGMAAKLMVKVHATYQEIASEYRLDIYGTQHIGQWFEIGPKNTNWPGVMFGIAGGEIDFHAVGSKGSLPEKSVLHYSLKGLKLNLGEKEYVAWAAQNELNPETSYFVRVKGFPDSFLFGSYSTQEEAELHVIKIN